MTPQSPSLTPTTILLLLALALVWGGSFFLAEIALREVPPLTVALHRQFWALPFLGLVLFWRGCRIPATFKAWRAYLVMGALNNALPFSLIFWAQTHIDSGLASILNATTAVFGVVVAGVILKEETLARHKLLGAGLGLVGVAVIMGPGLLKGFDLTNFGQLAVLIAALSYALASVWGRVMLSEYRPEVNAFGMLSGSVILMFPIVLWLEGPPDLTLKASSWVALISLASFSTALAYLLYFAILARAGAANLMLVTLLIPPVAVTLGVVFLNESAGSGLLIGALLIGLSLLVTDGRLPNLVQRRNQRRPRRG